MWLQVRMYLLLGVMFAILYALLVAVGSYMGVGSFFSYLILGFVMLFVQFMIGPKLVEWTMRVKYVTPQEEPELHKIVEELSRKAGIKKPRVAISSMNIPNAFAFGRWGGDARVCVTRNIMNLLSEDELKAVIGHELSHVKNRDVMVITLLSIVPMICWYIAMSFMYGGRDREGRGNAAFLGIAAFLLYFITNLLVLYGSRIREYYADLGSVKLGNQPHYLASALYKIVYGSAKTPQSELQKVQGARAFFLNDPARAMNEIQELQVIDANLSGTIDLNELMDMKNKEVKLSSTDKLMEIFTTHPNMLKRIKHLSTLT